MALTPPRRGEFLTEQGVPTRRFIKWIESLTDLAVTTEVVVSDIQDDTAGMQALKNKRAISKIQEPEQLQKPRVKTENDDTELAQLRAMISKLDKRIKNLESEI